MKKTKSCRRFYGVVLTIVLVATCFPTGILAQTVNGYDQWIEQSDLNISYEITGNESATRTSVPTIVFSDHIIYNGTPQIMAEVSPSPDGPELNPELIEITYKGTQANGGVYVESTIPPTAAGIYTVAAGYQGDDAYESYEETKEIEIKPMELKTTDFFTEKPVAKIYDGNTNVSENTIVGLGNIGVVKEDSDQVVFSFKSASFLSKDVKPESPNTVTLKDVSISGNQGANYRIAEDEKENKSLKDSELKVINVVLSANIEPKPVEVILSGQDKVYDGNADLHEYELTINEDDLIQGEEIGISTNDEFHPWYGEDTIQNKDVGLYYVWASGGSYFYGMNETNSDNYIVKNDPISSKEQYAITPAAVTVIPSHVSKIQGDADPVLTYDVWQDEPGGDFTEGLYGDDVLYGSLERETGEALGTYGVFLGSLNNPNYFISFADGEGKFEIIGKDEAAGTYSDNDQYYSSAGFEEKEEKSPVPYFGIALLLLLLIAGGIFFGKNRLTDM